MQSNEGVREASERGAVTVATAVGAELLYLAVYYSTSCKRAIYDTSDYHRDKKGKNNYHNEHS